jgi:hypothetical protein
LRGITTSFSLTVILPAPSSLVSNPNSSLRITSILYVSASTGAYTSVE